ncbi:lysylphosphatidylglycerol synthase transmembrane domain-containing protein [Methanothrix sp.]|uniref:lysylphosphatidylglycerol synthase transmembrane domain-containing protein n=1 Tax=Methanothrix sp. TaxID=90426 RepID=UPI003BB79007
MNERLKATLFVALMSLASIIFILYYTDADISWELLSRVNGWFLLLAVALHVFSWMLYALRLKLLASMAGHEITLPLSFRCTLASNFLAAITPSSAGGEPLRIKVLADDGMSYGAATAVVISERLLDSIFFLTSLALFLMVSGFFAGFGLKVGAIFLVFLLAFLAFLRQLIIRPKRVARLMEWIKKKTGNRAIVLTIEREIWLFRDAGIQLAKETMRCLPVLVVMTALIWFSDFLVPSALLAGMAQDPSILLSVTAQNILAIVSLLPLTPGASGIAELGMSYLYSTFVSPALLLPLIVLWRLITYFLNIVVGAAFAGATINGMMKK